MPIVVYDIENMPEKPNFFSDDNKDSTWLPASPDGLDNPALGADGPIDRFMKDGAVAYEKLGNFIGQQMEFLNEVKRALGALDAKSKKSVAKNETLPDRCEEYLWAFDPLDVAMYCAADPGNTVLLNGPININGQHPMMSGVQRIAYTVHLAFLERAVLDPDSHAGVENVIQVCGRVLRLTKAIFSRMNDPQSLYAVRINPVAQRGVELDGLKEAWSEYRLDIESREEVERSKQRALRAEQLVAERLREQEEASRQALIAARLAAINNNKINGQVFMHAAARAMVEITRKTAKQSGIPEILVEILPDLDRTLSIPTARFLGAVSADPDGDGYDKYFTDLCKLADTEATLPRGSLKGELRVVDYLAFLRDKHTELNTVKLPQGVRSFVQYIAGLIKFSEPDSSRPELTPAHSTETTRGSGYTFERDLVAEKVAREARLEERKERMRKLAERAQRNDSPGHTSETSAEKKDVRVENDSPAIEALDFDIFSQGLEEYSIVLRNPTGEGSGKPRELQEWRLEVLSSLIELSDEPENVKLYTPINSETAAFFKEQGYVVLELSFNGTTYHIAENPYEGNATYIYVENADLDGHGSMGAWQDVFSLQRSLLRSLGVPRIEHDNQVEDPASHHLGHILGLIDKISANKLN